MKKVNDDNIILLNKRLSGDHRISYFSRVKKISVKPIKTTVL
jgi:hypothetical protein